MNMQPMLGKPYTSVKEASKSRNYALAFFYFNLAVQAVFLLFIGWISSFSYYDSNILLTWPNYDGMIFFALVVILYFYNSRIVASLLLALTTFDLVTEWILKANQLGDFSPPSTSFVLAIAASFLTFYTFKAYAFCKANDVKLPRPKWVMVTMIVTLVLMLASFIVPPVSFWYHTKFQVSVVNKGNIIEYYDPSDRYSFDFPKTWTYEQPFLQYGNVFLHPVDDPEVSVQIERWGGPWNIAPIALVNKDAFLKMAQGDASYYASKNNLTVKSVEMRDSGSLNESIATFTGPDGSEQYVDYIYDTSWSRQTSASAYYLWELTATIPANSLRYATDTQSILNSFKINQPAP